MIRFHLAPVLKRKGWTPYRLSRETGLTVPTAYRLADPTMEFGRFTADTLDRLCTALAVQPGELLDRVPDKKRNARVAATSSRGAQRHSRTRQSGTNSRW